jgi:hypothetical protein
MLVGRIWYTREDLKTFFEAGRIEPTRPLMRADEADQRRLSGRRTKTK